LETYLTDVGGKMFRSTTKLFFIFIMFILSSLLTAIIINVPSDQPTIQAGIDIASAPDTVLVQPGTYVENINYYNKSITVASLLLTTQNSLYISQTIIDGNSIGSVVTFEYGEDADAVLYGFTITNGHSVNGGGIFCESSSPSLKYLLIRDNSTIDFGSGLYCFDANPSLENVTIADNTAGWDGGGISCHYSSHPILMNSILWDNSPQEIYHDVPSSAIATYSNIEGGWTGTGNLDDYPLFVDPANGNYNLSVISPCIDAGDPASQFDPDGTIADMGAYYYDQGSGAGNNEFPISNFKLYNFPNPFNPSTTISFDIKENETGTLTLFNIKGQITESHQFESGNNNYIWDASLQTSGIYFYQLKTEGAVETRKMLLLK
jgi:hypothetical protein